MRRSQRGPGRSAPPGLTAARLLRAVGFTSQRFSKVCDSGEPVLELYPGVASTLTQLARDGVELGVVTNLPAWIAKPMLTAVRLTDVLEVVVDYTATTRHKPKPDPLVEACRRLSCRPQDAWYVGDTHDDARAADAAGMSFAWASWGYTDVPPAGAHRVLERPEDIATLLLERP